MCFFLTYGNVPLQPEFPRGNFPKGSIKSLYFSLSISHEARSIFLLLISDLSVYCIYLNEWLMNGLLQLCLFIISECVTAWMSLPIPARLILSTSSLQTSSMWLRRRQSALRAPLKASVGRLGALQCRPVARGTHSSGAAWGRGRQREEWKTEPGATLDPPSTPPLPLTQLILKIALECAASFSIARCWLILPSWCSSAG